MVRGTADPSASLGMTKERATVPQRVVAGPKRFSNLIWTGLVWSRSDRCASCRHSRIHQAVSANPKQSRNALYGYDANGPKGRISIPLEGSRRIDSPGVEHDPWIRMGGGLGLHLDIDKDRLETTARDIKAIAATTGGPIYLGWGTDLYAPAAKLIDNIGLLNERLAPIHFQLATAGEFFRSAATTRGITTLSGEIPSSWANLTTSQLPLWLPAMNASNTLVSAEKFASINYALGYAGYPGAALRASMDVVPEAAFLSSKPLLVRVVFTKPVASCNKNVPQGLLNAAKVMSCSQVELPNAAPSRTAREVAPPGLKPSSYWPCASGHVGNRRYRACR